jgi:hypothetical protein
MPTCFRLKKKVLFLGGINKIMSDDYHLPEVDRDTNERIKHIEEMLEALLVYILETHKK